MLALSAQSYQDYFRRHTGTQLFEHFAIVFFCAVLAKTMLGICLVFYADGVYSKHEQELSQLSSKENATTGVVVSAEPCISEPSSPVRMTPATSTFSHFTFNVRPRAESNLSEKGDVGCVSRSRAVSNVSEHPNFPTGGSGAANQTAAADDDSLSLHSQETGTTAADVSATELRRRAIEELSSIERYTVYKGKVIG